MVALCFVMLACVIGFSLCAMTHDRFGKTIENLLVRMGITLIFLFVVCGTILLLNLIDYFL
jgi:hypothetical protein